MQNPLGTCTVIEIDSLEEVIEYFRIFRAQSANTHYEIRGVSVNELHVDSGSSRTDCGVQCTCDDNIKRQPSVCPCEECYAISLYSICFSVIKSCKYWNAQTIASIIENGMLFI